MSRTRNERLESREALFNFIVDYQGDHGYPPKYREMEAATGIPISNVKYHLDVLVEMGRIERIPGSPRAIKVLAVGG